MEVTKGAVNGRRKPTQRHGHCQCHILSICFVLSTLTLNTPTFYFVNRKNAYINNMCILVLLMNKLPRTFKINRIYPIHTLNISKPQIYLFFFNAYIKRNAQIVIFSNIKPSFFFFNSMQATKFHTFFSSQGSLYLDIINVH